MAVMEVLLNKQAEPDVYSYRNKERYEELVEYRLARDESAREAEEVALAAWRGLGAVTAAESTCGATLPARRTSLKSIRWPDSIRSIRTFRFFRGWPV